MRYSAARSAAALLAGMSYLFIAGCEGSPTDPPGMVDSGSWYRSPFKWPHDGHPFESANFVIYSDAASLEARQDLAEVAEEVLTLVMAELETQEGQLLYPPGQDKLHIYAYKNRNPRNWSGQGYYGGLIIYSLDHKGRIKLGRTDPVIYRTLLIHELTHVVQGLLIGNDHPSLADEWLAEGLAQYLAESPLEPGVPTRARLEELIATWGGRNPIAQHIGDDYTTQEGLNYFYPMYKLAVTYLIDPGGLGVPLTAFRDLFLDMRGVSPCYVGGVCPQFATAFQARIGLSLADYERDFFPIVRAYLK